MNHNYEPYNPPNIAQSESNYLYYKCKNCGHVAFDTDLRPSTHSPYYKYFVGVRNYPTCSQLIMMSILE